MSYRFILHKNRCSACAACVIGCMDKTDIPAEEQLHPLRFAKILELFQDDGACQFEYYTLSCLHCVDAPCATTCPSGCIHRDEETGFVLVDNSSCIGCQSCYASCPAHIPQFRASDGKMVKCDGCIELVTAGKGPACVQSCPYGALELVRETDYNPDEDALPNLILY